MNIGQQLQHKFISNLTAEVIKTTSKGYQLETKQKISLTKTKTKKEFYDAIDFDSEKGIWLKK